MAHSLISTLCLLALCVLGTASASRLGAHTFVRTLQQGVQVTPLGAPTAPTASPGGACQDIPPPPGPSNPSGGVVAATPGVTPEALSALQAAQAQPSLGSVLGLLNAIGTPGPAAGGLPAPFGTFTCAQQKAFGQCGAGFMNPQLGAASFCAITCGRCTPPAGG